MTYPKTPRSFWAIATTLLSSVAPLAPAADAPAPGPAAIPESHYVTISPDGHLQTEGQRVRYWTLISNWIFVRPIGELEFKTNEAPDVRQRKLDRLYRDTTAFSRRVVDLGFNMVRVWDSVDLTQPYVKGDGSKQDLFAYGMNELDKRGVKLWFSKLGAMKRVLPEDVAIIDDPATADAWKNAVASMAKDGKGAPLDRNVAYYWDARLAAIRLARLRANADFPNHYKGGMRVADDPQIAVWELTNEEWWFSHMVNGDWQKLPAFFRDGLIARWNAFLVQKYGDEARLRSAWGFLLNGESLDKKNLALAPLAKPSEIVINDLNTAAAAALTASHQTLSRNDFTRQRGADVIEFLVDMHIAQKQAEANAVKTFGRSCKLSPLVWDTGEGYRVQSVYMQQHADAVAMCTYMEGFARDPQQPRFPWLSLNDEPPRTSLDVPWAEIGRIPGKPFFLYETQISNPAKYRVDWPYRIAALGAIQDWDIINWHLFSHPLPYKDENPYDEALDISHTGFPPNGYHFSHDEVQSSAMKTAGAIFRSGALKPAALPTLFTWGRESLYDPASMDYGRSFGRKGDLISPTAYRYGAYMAVDPSQEKDRIKGPTVLPRVNEPNVIRPTDEITFDTRRAHLLLDAPSAIAYNGFFAQYGGPVIFKNGLTLDQVRIINPPDMPYPVTDAEKYLGFAAVAQDGLPLAQSKKIIVSLVSTSFNTGYSADAEKVAVGKFLENQKVGKAPVLVARVGAVISGPALAGMSYKFLDWAMSTIGEGVIEKDRLTIPADQPVFCVELSR